MTPYRYSLTGLKPSHETIALADSSSIQATHSGVASLSLAPGSRPHRSLLVPDLQEPLLSISSLCDDGLVVVFDKDRCSIHSSDAPDLSQPPLGTGYRRGNLYYLPSKVGASQSKSTVVTKADFSLLDWHVKLGHIGLRSLKALLKGSGVKPKLMNEIMVQRCPTCVTSKMSRHPFHSRSSYRANAVGDLIHSDVCSFETQSREGFK